MNRRHGGYVFSTVATRKGGQGHAGSGSRDNIVPQTTTRTTEQPTLFGVIQLFTLGIFLFGGALLAVPMYNVHVSKTLTLGESISALLPATGAMWILWLVELVLYTAIAFIFSRNILTTLAGLALGLFTRIILSVMVAFLISVPMGSTFGPTMMRFEGELWVYRAIAILVTVLSCLFAYRGLFEQWFGFKAPVGKSGKASGKQFSFNTRAVTPVKQFQTRTNMPTAPTTEHLHPPEGFAMPPADDSVFGEVELPSSVILDSIPEALPFLDTKRKIPVRLALIVPQLHFGTVWLTWGQIFNTSAHATGDEALIANRWIRVPPKHYATHVPRDYYGRRKSPPAWMKMAEVPQETQFGEFREAVTPQMK